MAVNTSTGSTRLADILAMWPKDAVAAVCAPSHQSDLAGADVVDGVSARVWRSGGSDRPAGWYSG